ncbi:MAG TPA: ABA4-like family protein [Caldilineaceae bacterium]|nr:ABA4-like family protein [Caldilineaceae bacterium]
MFDTLFSLSNILTMPFWFLMILLPTWRWTERLMQSVWTVAPAALAYVILVLPGMLSLLPLLANPQLGTIAALLGTPAGATIGWIHFLAFDLFVGRWAYLDSRQRRLHPVLASITLFFILMFGPLGFMLYLIMRSLFARQSNRMVATPASS